MKEQSENMAGTIPDILKLCSRLKIKTIKIDSLGLEVTFADEPDSFNNKKKLTSDQEDKRINSIRAEELSTRELRLSQLDIEDPHAFEEILLSESEKEFINAGVPKEKRLQPAK